VSTGYSNSPEFEPEEVVRLLFLLIVAGVLGMATAFLVALF